MNKSTLESKLIELPRELDGERLSLEFTREKPKCPLVWKPK